MPYTYKVAKTVQWSSIKRRNHWPIHWCKMVAVSLAYFIFDEIMRPSVNVSEGPRITLRYTKTDFFIFIRINGDGLRNLYANLQQWIFRQHMQIHQMLRFEVEKASRGLSAIAELLVNSLGVKYSTIKCLVWLVNCDFLLKSMTGIKR